jgi:hypothetical protein
MAIRSLSTVITRELIFVECLSEPVPSVEPLFGVYILRDVRVLNRPDCDEIGRWRCITMEMKLAPS